jgi:hypothetical protein
MFNELREVARTAARPVKRVGFRGFVARRRLGRFLRELIRPPLSKDISGGANRRT